MPISDPESISGRQRVAILMLALGSEHSAKLLGMMHEDEIKEVSTAMTVLGAVKANVVEQLCQKFTEGIGQQGDLTGSYEITEQLLRQALPPDSARQIMEAS